MTLGFIIELSRKQKILALYNENGWAQLPQIILEQTDIRSEMGDNVFIEGQLVRNNNGEPLSNANIFIYDGLKKFDSMIQLILMEL